MDSDMEWIRPRPKMTEKQWNVYRRPISLVLNIGLIVKHYTTQCDKCIQKIVNAAEQLLYSQCFFSWPLWNDHEEILMKSQIGPFIYLLIYLGLI